MKRCITCNYVRPLVEFYFRGDKVTLNNTCKDCVIARSKKWQEDNPDQTISISLKNKYGITLEEKKEMIRQQGGKCAICGDKFRNEKSTHVDHCHKTNDIRSILCGHCNMGLGHFKDSKKLLKAAINYLGEHAKKRTATLISTGHNIQGELYPELGPIPAAGTREDGYDLDHYQRTIRGEDADYRAQTRGGDGVGYGGEKVATSTQAQGSQDHGDTGTKAIGFEFGGRHLFG